MSARTPEEIADRVLRDHAIQPNWSRTGEQVRNLLVEAVEATQTEPSDFAPEGESDKYRDLWNENMPRVSGSIWLAIPGEQPIFISDEQARRILVEKSEEER